MNLQQKKYWVFDMDGTLTVPKHDFAAIRKKLGIPPDHDILAFIESCENKKRETLHTRLEEIEYALALQGETLPDCKEFLDVLIERGCSLGVVTRNSVKNTDVTLRSAGLSRYFPQESIKTRECALPKPDPDPLHQLLALWGAQAAMAVMVGDYKHDLNAGHAAGMNTIFFDSHGFSQWNDLSDLTVSSWLELRELYSKDIGTG